MSSAPPPVWETIRTLPRAAWFLFLGTFINRFGSFVAPFLILYLTGRGYSATDAGMAVGAYGIGHIAASLGGGYLADRIGRRPTIVISMFSAAATMIALSQARAFGWIVFWTVMAGLTAELYRPASAALLADLVPPERRVAAYGMYRLAINAGFAAGPATAGFLAQHSYEWLFIGDAVTSAIYGIVALAALPAGVRSSPEKSGWGEALRHAGHDRRFIFFLIASMMLTFIEFQLSSTVALHVKGIGHSAATYGMLISLNGLLIILFEVPLTAVTQRFPVRRMIALGIVLQGIGFGLTGAAHSFLALAGTVVLWTLGEMIFAPTSSAYVAGIAPDAMRGRYMGLWTLMWSAGLTLGPALGSALFERNASLLWLLCFILGLGAAVLVSLDPAPQKADARPFLDRP
jgi:MFS family permease